MNIVIDARMLTWTGIGRYTSHLLEELQGLDTKNHYLVLLGASDYETWQPTAPNFHKVRANSSPYGLSGQLQLPRLLRQLQPDLVHFTHFTVPLGYRGKYVVTIHDLTLLSYSVRASDTATSRLQEVIKQRTMHRVIKQAIHKAQSIITPSKYVATQISNSYSTLPSKITTTYEAADTISTRSQTYEPPLSQKFILYVGNAYPNKNLRRLIDAFDALDRPGYSLVLVGKQDYFYDQLERYVARKRIKGVIFTGFVSDAELAWLYQQATAYVFPSLSEGFGLPGLEAMAQGLPVISSNATCLPEVYDTAAHYFDPRDPSDMVTKIQEVLDEPKLREKLIEAGTARVKEFSWERMARQTLQVYEEAAS